MIRDSVSLVLEGSHLHGKTNHFVCVKLQMAEVDQTMGGNSVSKWTMHKEKGEVTSQGHHPSATKEQQIDADSSQWACKLVKKALAFSTKALANSNYNSVC